MTHSNYFDWALVLWNTNMVIQSNLGCLFCGLKADFCKCRFLRLAVSGIKIFFLTFFSKKINFIPIDIMSIWISFSKQNFSSLLFQCMVDSQFFILVRFFFSLLEKIGTKFFYYIAETSYVKANYCMKQWLKKCHMKWKNYHDECVLLYTGSPKCS